jgi:hypothetical protein
MEAVGLVVGVVAGLAAAVGLVVVAIKKFSPRS